ncbi:MAG: hypothetical protein K2W82_16555 [Candidatus Obscuribacterales bacterium]|nr:hypothetical protein [Candidatus Obscuribacterales bacterium]
MYLIYLIAIVFWEVVKYGFVYWVGAAALVSGITWASGGSPRTALICSVVVGVIVALIVTMGAIENGFH